jgi:hypothetical protein
MAYTYTLTNLLVATRELLNEPTASFWTDATLTSNINEGMRVIAQTTGCYRTIQSVSTVGSTRLVSYTGYKCIAIEYNNIALIKITPVELGHVPLDGITPQYWFEEANKVGIEPIPPAIYSLTVYACAAPTDLSGASDVPVIPYSLCGLIPYYAAAKALYQDSKNGAAAQLMGMFNKELDFMSKSLLPNIPNIPNTLESMRFQ